MFPNEMWIFKQLAVLVVCHGLATGQNPSHYFFIQKRMPWGKGREYCQSYFVDLAILTMEREYFKLLNATPANKGSFWVGLHRQSNGWRWINGEELNYKQWYNYNVEGNCVSLEAMLEKNNKLLARVCNEQHMVVCQGPVSPQSVTVDSVSINRVNLSWNISAFMQMTSHYYNITICSFCSICETLSYPHINGSSIMSIDISNLTASTEYLIYISAAVVTGRKLILQDNPATLTIKTVASHKIHKIYFIILNLLNLVFLVPPFWFIYHMLKKDESAQKVRDISSPEPLTEDTLAKPLPQRSGLEKQQTVIFF